MQTRTITRGAFHRKVAHRPAPLFRSDTDIKLTKARIANSRLDWEDSAHTLTHAGSFRPGRSWSAWATKLYFRDFAIVMVSDVTREIILFAGPV